MDHQDKLDAELWRAVLNNNVYDVWKLLDAGADPDAELEKAYKVDIEAYKKRQQKANPDIRCPNMFIGSDFFYEGKNWRPLNVAAAHGQAEISELLHQTGGRGCLSLDINPLELAAANGHETVTAFLLSTGDYDPLIISAYENNAATAAAQSGDERTLVVVVEHVAREGRLNEMLFGEYMFRPKSLTEAAMAEGFDPNAKTDGSTALHKAARSWVGYDEDGAALKVFIMGGANVDARDCDGNTPLHVAAEEGKTWMCSVLLAEGADILARNAEGKTPADVAEANRPENASANRIRCEELLRSCQNGSQAESSAPEQKPAEQSKSAARRI
jgi:hypothetical protein